jgi:hypothetical protein
MRSLPLRSVTLVGFFKPMLESCRSEHESPGCGVGREAAKCGHPRGTALTPELFDVAVVGAVQAGYSNFRSQILRTEILQGWLSISKPMRPGWLLTESLVSSIKIDISWPFIMWIMTGPRAMIS